ncbi:MAG: acyl-CoA dehydrogenase family protein [Myxococcota bacterium]|nr:acyl-CoA dehydrogenase family protein [Myxococcota bacterium]
MEEPRDDDRPFDLFAPTPEHALLRDTLRSFVEREVEPQAMAYDRDERFNHALFRKAGELGVLGVTLPEEYGGAGLDAVAAVQVCEALSTSDPGFALSVLAHSILFAHNLSVNGSELQRKHVLPRAATGEWIGGLCMTEPEVGTDVLSLKTTARRDGDVYRLTGRKTFITNGGVDETTLGDCFIVYAATAPKTISSFLVEKGMPGFSLGQKWKDKVGMRASFTAELVFDDVPVPVANRVGDEGEGTLHMMRNLEIERLTLAAMSLGIAQRSLQVMVDYASDRKAFGRPIRDFGQIQRHVAESFAEWRASRTFVYDVARKIDLHGAGQRLDADATKLVASQMAKRAADAAMQVLGGYGYMGEYVVSRLWRDAKLLEIGGGTLEAHHKNLSRELARNPGVLRD